MGSFSYTSHSCFFFYLGVSLTHPVLALFLYLGSFSYTSHAGFIFLSGVSLMHPMLASFLNLGSFSYMSCAGFIFIWGDSLKYPLLASSSFSYHVLPMLTLFLCGEFLLHIPCCRHLYARSFSYTSRAVLIFYLGSFSSTSCAGLFYRGSLS